ncbi:hypothetical protein D8M34_18160 [Microbacterium sp. HSID17254]|uniref:hypothetical protein n=1 Tax=Microbacterium sp. HSID17254 TaxID=2419509 RepID=UPI000F88496B|nr:hypothetical protein [Microbacterium sp. HSID17254]RUQ02350.1 hypothetical protein D8M34_18160 [Microbacterium sp. HSID17254]
MSQQDHRAHGAPSPDADGRAAAVVSRMVSRHGAPSLEHYRAIYADLGLDWPGDAEIRRTLPVDDAA